MNDDTTPLNPDGQIARIEAQIRSQPAVAAHRWALFQWLCVARAWDRAIRQLQAYAQLDASQVGVAQSCRDLIRAERWREKVLAGAQEPGFVYDDVPQWIRGLLSALALARTGDHDGADAARAAALGDAPGVAGKAGEHRFVWIADSDSRLGPVCEFVVAGRYRWLSLADITSWQIAPPAAPIDLVWAASTLTLVDGTTLRGFMPARYPRFSAIPDEPDDVLLGRRTVWHEMGSTGVIGTGRKTWMTAAGDFGLFELGAVTLGTAS